MAWKIFSFALLLEFCGILLLNQGHVSAAPAEVTWTWDEPKPDDAASFRKYEFTLVQQDVTFDEAREACAARGGARLVQPDSPAKNDFIKAQLRTINPIAVWIGASRNPDSIEEWLYTDGSKVDFTNWGQGEPNNWDNREWCAQMWQGRDFAWNDIFCTDSRRPFMCETSYEAFDLDEREFETLFGLEPISDPEELELASAILKDNEARITETNRKFSAGEVTWHEGLYEWSNQPEDKFVRERCGLNEIDGTEDPESVAFFNNIRNKRSSVPDSYSSVDEGNVSPVKNQGPCGSCVAFATFGQVETCFKKEVGVFGDYSEQQLMDCGYGYYNANACGGAGLSSYIRWLADKKEKLSSEDQYPYQARLTTCPAEPKVFNQGVAVSGKYLNYNGDEELLKKLVYEHGAVVIGVQARGAFSSYRGGIFAGCDPNVRIDHAVVAVGYGTENGKDYWLVKNSWGAGWGENGYIRMERGSGQCGIGKYNVLATCSKVATSTADKILYVNSDTKKTTLVSVDGSSSNCEVADYPGRSYSAPAATYNQGVVMVCGGVDLADSNKCWKYDGSVWSSLPDSNQRHCFAEPAMSTSVQQGWWVTGRGQNGNGGCTLDYTGEVFTGEEWIEGPSHPTGGYTLWSCVASLNSTHTMFIGGLQGTPTDMNLADTWLYNWNTGKWTETGKMNTARTKHGCVSLGDQGVLVVAGGRSGPDTVELYNPATETWEVKNDIPGGLFPYYPTILNWGGDAIALFIGHEEIYKWSKDDDEWSVLEGKLPEGFSAKAVLVPEDFVPSCM